MNRQKTDPYHFASQLAYANFIAALEGLVQNVEADPGAVGAAKTEWQVRDMLVRAVADGIDDGDVLRPIKMAQIVEAAGIVRRTSDLEIKRGW